MPTILYKNSKGQRIPGVTTVISANLGWNKQALMYWAWNEGMEGRNFRDTSQRAADAGTIAHEMIECDIKGKEFQSNGRPQELIDKAETCYINFLDWKQKVKFSPFKTEIHLVSEKWQFGATPDCPAFIEDKLTLFDWKTGSGLYPDMLMQLAAYEIAWNENYPKDLMKGFYLLRIGKEDASWHYHHWDALPEAWECFKHLLELHKLQKILKKKV